jgi:hypothetical protein
LFFFEIIETGSPSMQLQQIPFYYPINSQGIIQAAGVGPHQNIMIPSGSSSSGQGTSAPPPIYYSGVYAGIFQKIFSL